MNLDRTGNRFRLLFITAVWGGFAGGVVWCFLKAAAFCTEIIWKTLPEKSGFSFLPVVICAAGGILLGALHKKYGDYPEELSVVMFKIKRDKYYDYKNIAVMMLCAFIPLVLCASVGPEAGLTGIIAALCYWIGDNVSYAGVQAAGFSKIGEAVTLGQLFHSPLFGILAVEENEDDTKEAGTLSKTQKLLYYGISAVSAFLITRLLNTLFGTAMEGFPSFSEVPSGVHDYLLLLIYIPAGLLIYLIFEFFEGLTKSLAGRIPVILRGILCGIIVGFMGIFIPVVMSSGEEQMAGLMKAFSSYPPLFLVGICILKLLMTAFCINFGMKGGHFFPLIFACTCMGFALSNIFFSASESHGAFAAAVVTATVLGAQLKKPLAAALLLLLCFPPGLLLWSFVCAAIGDRAGSAMRFTASAKELSGDQGDIK